MEKEDFKKNSQNEFKNLSDKKIYNIKKYFSIIK